MFRAQRPPGSMRLVAIGGRRMFSNSSGFKTRILTVVAMGLASSVAGHAVTNFNAPNATLVSSCSAFAVTGNGTLSGVVANNGHGISVSGNGSLRRTAPVNDCLTLHWAGTGSGPFDASTLPALYDFTITAPGNGFVTGWNLTFTANPGINQVATPFSCQVQESQPLSPMRSMAVLPRIQVSQVCNGVTSFRVTVQVVRAAAGAERARRLGGGGVVQRLRGSPIRGAAGACATGPQCARSVRLHCWSAPRPPLRET